MRTFIFALLSILLTSTAIAQKNKVGVSFSPNYAYRITEANSQSMFLAPSDNEIPKIGYRFTAFFERDFHKRASFFTGLSLANNGFQTEKRYLLFSGNNPNPPPYFSARLRTNLHQIGIPVGVNLFFPVKKVRFFISAGASANYLYRVRTATIFYTASGTTEKSTSTGSQEFYEPFNFEAFGSFGIEFSVFKNLLMRIAPNIHYTFTNVKRDDRPEKVFPTSSGVSFSVYKLL